MSTTHPKVDAMIDGASEWRAEYEALRAILLECGLSEAYKWRQACYTYGDANICLIHSFKSYFALSFLKGSLLKDPHGWLERPGENTQGGRVMKFTDAEEIEERASEVKAYVFEAIEVEKAGLKAETKTTEDYAVPEELTEKLEKDASFMKAFAALTPGRQRGYLLHFAGAKQSSTRSERIENYRDRIMDGKGIHDCVCGHSKRYPRCDGSHKNFKSD